MAHTNPRRPLKSKAPSSEQQAFYRDNGYLIVEGVLSPARLRAVRDALEDRLVFEGPQAGSEGSVNPGVRRLCNLFAKGRVFEEMATEPIVLEMARLTIGPAVRWHGMNLHDPIPGQLEADQAIHADRSFYPNCTGFLNVCWAIDAMTEENGATRIVPGSHKRGCWPGDLLSVEQTRAPIEGEIHAVCTAGSALFVHGEHLAQRTGEPLERATQIRSWRRRSIGALYTGSLSR